MEIRVNGKKVSLSHYLNKELESYSFEGSRYFQLYTQIVYKTKSTRFKAFKQLELKKTDRVWIDERHEEKINTSEFKEIAPLVYQSDLIVMQIVEHEIKRFGEKFTLSGFGKRLDVYGKRIEDICTDIDFKEIVTFQVQHHAKDGISVMARIYTPTVYEWLLGNGKASFVASLKEKAHTDKTLNIIDLKINELINLKK